MKRYVMIVVSPARPTPTARAAAACPSSCVDPARESRRRACSVPRTPTARHRTCQPPLGGGVTSSAAIDSGRGGVSETGALRWDFSPIPSGNLGDLDFIASPNLFTIPGGTTPRALVGVGSKNGVYYTVDRDTGAPVWQQAVVSGGISGGVSPSTGVAFGKVYAATFTGPPYIFALDAERRRRVASSRQLRAFDAGTGALLWKLDLGGDITSGPAVVNDMVFVGVGLGPMGESQGVYGLGLERRHASARTRTASLP